MLHSPKRFRFLRVFSFAAVVAVVLAVYGFVGSREITLPGVYMDAVNPDYLVVKLLNWHHAKPLTAWVLPGNYLHDRVPILISLYHGLQQFWLGLPLYALFGTGVVGIRLTHMVFACGVLVAMLFLLRAANVPAWIAALCGVAIACDPSFIFAFRTQSYITMAPAMWLLLSMYCLLRTASADVTQRARLAFAGGVCYGFSVLGYFVYAFYLPPMLAAVTLLTPKTPASPALRSTVKHVSLWLVGTLAGVAYYIVGYALVAKVSGGGIRGFLAFYSEYSSRLGAFASTQSLGERATTAWNFVHSVFTNAWHHSLMFGSLEPMRAWTLKIAVLLCAPVLLLLAAELRGRASGLLRLAVALPMTFFAVSLIFGERLGGHHYMSLLPVSYVALAAGIAATWPSSGRWRPQAAIPVVFGVGAMIVANALATNRELATLERTGGVGLFSDAINRLAADLDRASPKPHVYFPDWGLVFPVLLITRGTLSTATDVDAREARRTLCSGTDVAIAVIGNERSGRIARWAGEFDWKPARIETYRERSGTPLIDLVTFAALDAHARCDVLAAGGR